MKDLEEGYIILEDVDNTENEIVKLNDCIVLKSAFDELYMVYKKMYKEMYKTKHVTNKIADDISTKLMKCTKIQREILEILKEI